MADSSPGVGTARPHPLFVTFENATQARDLLDEFNPFPMTARSATPQSMRWDKGHGGLKPRGGDGVQSGNIIYRTDRQHPLQLRVYGME